MKIWCSIILLVAVSAVSAILFSRGENVLGAMASAALILLAVYIVKLIKRADSDLALLVEAIRNNDSTLRLPKNKHYARVGEKLNLISQMLSEIKLKSAEEQRFFSVIIDNIPVGVMAVNTSGRIIMANRACKSMLNMDVIPCIQRIDRFSKSLADKLEAIHSKETETVELPDKTLSLSCSEAMFYHHGHVKLLVITEISADLNRKEQETWNLSVRTLSHEIMNSLAPIISISQTLSDLTDTQLDADSIREGLATISGMSENLLSFSQNYRALTLMPTPQIGRHSMLEMVKEVVEVSSHWHTDNKKVAFNIKISPTTVVNCDRLLTIRALSNIIKNAIEATATAEAPDISISEIKKKGKTSLTISNNGPKISADVAVDIFTPFFTTRKGGQGIGLALSKRIMTAQKGNLYLEPYNTSSQPTTFVFVFNAGPDKSNRL
ncbi:MAG: GHKL domain-containing protein [Muribaculaceae bacterium]|nr:GHKL domain-containing protein [Muribaculaceae bacterium]